MILGTLKFYQLIVWSIVLGVVPIGMAIALHHWRRATIKAVSIAAIKRLMIVIATNQEGGVSAA